MEIVKGGDGLDRSVKGAASSAGANDLAPLTGHAIAVLAAASPGEPAIASDYIKHGLLTSHLLRGLAGAADEDHDGRVTEDEIARYVRDRVAYEAARSGQGQTAVGQGVFAFESHKTAVKE